MTFQPVLPWAVLLAIAVVLIAIRLLSLHQLRADRRRPRIMLWRWCAATVALLLIDTDPPAQMSRVTWQLLLMLMVPWATIDP